MSVLPPPRLAYPFDVDRKASQKYVDFVLGSEDMSLLRFGLSPGSELSSGVCALQAPDGAPLQWGWLRAVSPRISERAWDVITTVIPPTGYYPDFLTTDPAWDLTPEAELEALRRVAVERVARDLTKVASRATGPHRTRVEAMLRSPSHALDSIANAWEEVWEAVMAPHWGQLRRLLQADVTRRARQLAETGISDMIGQLHERVTWEAGRVRVRMRIWSEEVHCQGSGLMLVPTVLGAPWCSVVTDPPSVPTLFYPVGGLSPDWPTGSRGPDASMSALLGASRAKVLLSLDLPRTTSDVAHVCGLALSTASHHLGVLRDARLVDSHRAGPTVIHTRTPLAYSLIAF